MRAAIGVDIGGTGIKAARVGDDGAILASISAPTPRAGREALAEVDRLIRELDEASVVAVGVGVPGRVDAAAGRALSGGYVDLSGAPLADGLPALRGRPLAVENDATLALIGEARIGAARGARFPAMLTLGTGVGGAALEEGRVLRGRGAAGQFGHVTVDAQGKPCNCGRRGCLETTSSGAALGAWIADAGLDPETKIETLLAADDARSRAVVERWAKPLRAGIDSIVAAIDPDRMVLGGALGGAAVEALKRFPPLSPWYQCDVVPAALGSRAGVVGAAFAALDNTA